MSVKLNFRKDEVNKDGEVPIFATFSIAGKQKHLRLGETFPLSKVEGKELKSGKDPVLDSRAKRIRAKISLIELELEKGRTANVKDLWEYIKEKVADRSNEGKESKKRVDFFDMWDQWDRHNEARISNQTNELISKGTKKNYKTVREQLREFSKTYALDISNLGKDFYGQFSTFIISEKGLTPNTFGNYIKILKTFMGWADEVLEERGVEISRKYTKFKCTYRYKGIDHLTSKELQLFKDFNTDKKHLRTACDLFLMMCYTGLNVGDLAKLKKDNCYLEEQKILIKRKKTLNDCVIPFFDDFTFSPVAMMNKYDYDLPKMPDQKINEHIKTIQQLLGFDKFVLTSRIGRKTFATIKHLEQGVPAHIVMMATGHTTYRQFMKYIGVDHKSVVGHFIDKAQLMKVS